MRKIFTVVALFAVLLIGGLSTEASVPEVRWDSETKPVACKKSEDEGLLKGLFKGFKGIIIHIFDLEGTEDPREPLCGIIIH